ncbi:hypothetical protein [Microbacterium istanbulense]|uniref:DUF4190 domain-containing protein n=1 Tax=Microbacterium istanbulense TaxID=3122049 RepID=A0ABU8LKE2_9MICO
MTDQPPPPNPGIPSGPPSAPAYQPPSATYPAYGSPAYGAPAPAPSQGLAIAGLVLAFVAAPVGLILSIVAAVKLKKQGAPRGLAIAGIIAGAILTVLGIAALAIAGAFFASIFSVCAEYGPGVWQVNGVTYTCS